MANFFCTAAKEELLDAKVGHVWKFALYTSAAALDADTLAYTSTNEVANGNGYLTGGTTLTGAAVGSASDTAWLDFADPSWSGATFTARKGMIYDSTDSNRAYAIIDFGSNKTGQGGNFTPRLPAPAATTAIIRI